MIALYTPRPWLRAAAGAGAEPTLTPWQSVGGCGAGGGSTHHVSPFHIPVLLDNPQTPRRLSAELAWHADFAQNFVRQTLYARCGGFAHKRLSFHLQMPLIFSTGEGQHRSGMTPKSYSTGGAGDPRIGAALHLFDRSALVMRAALQLPVGDYGSTRGKPREKLLLPSHLQKGAGFHVLLLSLHHQRALLSAGRWRFATMCALPFTMRVRTGKNELLSSNLSAYRHLTDDPRFYYSFKPYGENDYGRHVPAEIIQIWQYSHVSNEHVSHTWQTGLFVPLGVQWLPSDNPYRYDPHPDDNHRMWRTTWAYIPELRFHSLTIRGFMLVPLMDKANEPEVAAPYNDLPLTSIDSPDWREFGRRWKMGLSVGFSFLDR